MARRQCDRVVIRKGKQIDTTLEVKIDDLGAFLARHAREAEARVPIVKGTLFVERWMQRPGGKNRKGPQEEGEEYRGLLDGNSDEEDGDEEEDVNNYLSEIEESASELEDSGGKDGGGGEDLPRNFADR